MDLATTMQEKGVSQKCQDEAVANLASCAMDDSMAVKQGCCSIDCSTGIKKVGWLACWQPIAYTAPFQTAPPLKLVTAGMPQHTHHTSLAFPAFTSLYRESPSCTTCLATVEDTDLTTAFAASACYAPPCSPLTLVASTSTPRPSATTPPAKT